MDCLNKSCALLVDPVEAENSGLNRLRFNGDFLLEATMKKLYLEAFEGLQPVLLHVTDQRPRHGSRGTKNDK